MANVVKVIFIIKKNSGYNVSTLVLKVSNNMWESREVSPSSIPLLITPMFLTCKFQDWTCKFLLITYLLAKLWQNAKLVLKKYKDQLHGGRFKK